MSSYIFSCAAGCFEGFEESGCIQVKGIRYAISERFAEPVPYVYPSGIHACRESAPYAVQLPSAAEGNFSGMDYENQKQEESCQYLSMTIPADLKEGEKVPVMVWIHGGAYRNGGCDAISYDRSRMVKENRVILVGLNYRIGILGFSRDRSGNFANLGLLDLVEGLRWVKSNIAAFHGDTDSITIFGQSAGADAVRCLMISDGTDGLFQRCIIQSDPIGTLTGREDMEQKILDEVNAMPIDASIEEVLATQASVTAHVTEKGLAKYMIFGPHAGVYPLPPQSEAELKLREAAKKYDLLMGSNTREVSAYLIGKEPVRKLDNFPLTGWIVELVVSTLSKKIFIKPTEAFASRYASFGGNTYLYSFHWGAGKSFVGACHMMEFLPLFGSDYLKKDISKMGMSDEEIHNQGIPMRKIWAEFARTGKVTTKEVKGMLKIIACEEK